MELKAFLNSKQIQTKFVQRLEEHYIQDEIIKGNYWQNGKGCAVGCTIHSNSHNCYEIELGIPEWVARLEDVLFVGMPNEYVKEFPLKFIKSIPLGFENWQHIYHQLCVFMLEKICKNIGNKIIVKVICDIITLHKIESTDESAWSTAESAARSVARSVAESVARSAVRSTESTEFVARSAEFDAWSAAESAESAEFAWSVAVSAGSAEFAWSVAESAEFAWSVAESAGSAARSGTYKSIADKLIELLENEK